MENMENQYKVLAASPIRAAPAVCELEGPIITEPIISNTELNFTITPPLLNSNFLLNPLYQIQYNNHS